MRKESAALLALALGACGAPARVASPPKAAAQDEAPQAFASPAHWAYFPREPGQPTASLELSDHRCIVLTDAGDRWLVHGSAKTPCKGVATASSSPAYEALVGVVVAGNEYEFIAQSGTVFVASDPLGAFVRYTKPARPLHEVASAKGAIVGVDDAGNAYYFSADGPPATAQGTKPSDASLSGSWKQATQPPGSELFAVGVDDRGRALAVGVPESIYTSLDGGKTYALATANGSPRPPHVGAVNVTHSKKGELAIEGVMGSLIWEDGGTFARSTEPLALSGVGVTTVEPSATPATTAIREGRGIVTGDRYYDLRYPDGNAGPDDGGGSPYVLARGPLAGPLEIKRLTSHTPAAFAGCTDMRLGAHGRSVVITCAHPLTAGTDVGITILMSSDAGDHFDAVGELVTPSFSETFMAVGADGSLLMTNVCRPGGERRKHKDEHPEKEGCHPRGPMVVRVDSSKPHPARAKTPAKEAVSSASKRTTHGKSKSEIEKPEASKAETAKVDSPEGELHATFVQGNARELEAAAFGPAVGAEGRFYFLGRRKKDDRPAIFVSTDGGHTYEGRPLEAPTQDTTPAPDDGAGGEPDVAYTNLDFSNEAKLTIDDSGTLGLPCDSSAGYTWVTADSEGRVATVSGAPEQGASLGGWGRRVVSLGYGAQDGVIRAWESSDGGQSFSEITTTAAVGNYFNGDTMIACDGGGCLLGETLARIGWEGQAETPMNMQEDFPPTLDAKLRPTIACELLAKSKWTPVRNLSTEGTIYPRLFDMMRGSSAWALMTRDPESGEIDVTTASVDGKADSSSVQTHVILSGSTGKQGRIATTAKPQFEGFVAARATVPDAKGRLETGKPIDDLEVSWVNFYTGTWGKRSLHDAGTWGPSLASGNVLNPALLTIAGPNVVFRAGPSPKSLSFDGGSKTTVFDYPDWATLGFTGAVDSSDAALVGGQLFAIGSVTRPPTAATALAIAHKPQGGSTFQAEAITYGAGLAEHGWIYLGSENGVGALTTNVDQNTATSWGSLLQPDGSLGPRIPLPTLRDLGDKPRPCTADDRKTTFRTVASAFSPRGALQYRTGRQAIQVTEPVQSSKALVANEPIWFLSDGAVLYGTPKDPCVAGVRGSAVRHGSIVVISGDLDHAWMFRPSAMATSATPVCNCNPDDPLCQCPEEPVQDPVRKPGKRGRSQTSSVEFRAMTCKQKPELVAPYEVSSLGLVRLPDDAP